MMKILKNKLNKKIAISLILVCFIAIGSTLAYLLDISDLVTNTFTRASIHTEIKEDEKMTNLTKNPSVVNTDVTDVLVRVRLSITNKRLFEEHFGLAGIDDSYTSVFINEDEKEPAPALKYWTMVDENNNGRYDCYYYYNDVLEGKDGETTHSTEPLFDKILKKIEKSTDPYVEFVFNDDESVKNLEDVEILKKLESIEITVYQESVPTKITTKDGRTLNAVKQDGFVDIGVAKEIFAYFESNPESDTSNNN